jgi:F0F1-type ATP synthase membrane subunit c/vacuolar-type H+-ATPase subunit K
MRQPLSLICSVSLIVAVIISTRINPKAKSNYFFDDYAYLSSSLACGLSGLSTGMAIIVGDAGVRENAQQLKLCKVFFPIMCDLQHPMRYCPGQLFHGGLSKLSANSHLFRGSITEAAPNSLTHNIHNLNQY